MTKKTPTPENKVETEVAPETESKKELSTIQKVQLMNSLAAIATDESIKKLMMDKPHGSLVYDVFVESIEKKLNEIMNGKPEETQKNVTSVLAATGRLDVTVRELERLIVGFIETPLLGVLNLMNENLGGKKFEMDKNAIAKASAARAQPEVTVTPYRPQPQTQQSDDTRPAAYNKPIRTGGVGSF